MDAQRWRQIEDIYQSALNRSAESRGAFVTDACRGDADLLERVQSLLSANDQAGTFLEVPALEMASTLEGAAAGGQQVGSFRILHRIGAGGMGEVYRAHDGKLGRDVAIKMLPRKLADDRERVSRLRREARTVAALNHPNIAAIYDFVEEGSLRCLVLELVEGANLRGPLPIETALDYGRQIAGALEAAHNKGIVHRDLKPANVKVTPEGRVKVLDFGLAKAIWGSDDRPRLSQVNSVSGVGTLDGQIVGTPPYMSPEQARGETIDKRTDIWAFGCLLYELLTGKRAFEGESLPECVGAVLEREPDWSALPAKTPPKIRDLLHRCLEKDPNRRTQDMSAVRHVLEEVISSLHRSAATAAAKFAGIAVVLVVAGIVFLQWPKKAAALTQQDTILLADFANQTRDPVFDNTLRDALAIQLGQSPYLNLFPESRVRETLQYMERSPDTRLTPPIAREICRRQGLKAFLDGSIAPLGSKYVITLEAIRGDTGDTLVRAQAEAERKEDVLHALGNAATTFRRNVGELLQSVQRFDVPVEQATTSSIEALQAFSLGDEKQLHGRDAEAIPFYKHSIELDPQFAMAWARLGASYQVYLQDELSKQAHAKAYEFRARATERERLYIEHHYFGDVIGDTEKAIETCRLSVRVYPHDWRVLSNLAEFLQDLGMYEQSLPEARQAMSLSPQETVPPLFVGRSLMFLNRGGEARAVLQKAAASGTLAPALHWSLQEMAVADNDQHAIDDEYSWGQKSPLGDWIIQEHGMTALGRGRPADAAADFRRAAELPLRRDSRDDAARHLSDQLLGFAVLGRCANAAPTSRQIAGWSEGGDKVGRAAVALALCGHAGDAIAMARKLAEARPKDTLVNAVWVPLIRGAAALRGQPSEAVELLQPALRYDFAYEASAYPDYVRGLAYLAQRDGKNALAEFKKILSHPYLYSTEAYYALSQLGAARAAALAGDTALSRRYYQQFFESWKNADPDLPQLAAAKNEFAELR